MKVSYDSSNDYISVVVPIYNVAEYLIECLESVLNQTYTYYEMILVDDGSTDESGTICDKYAEKYENIMVYHQKNQGLSAARNTGISYAKGSYICFIDSDDVVHRQYLEILYHNAKKNSADISICSYESFETLEQVQLDAERNNVSKLEYKIELMKRLTKIHIDQDNITTISAWNKLYRIELFHSHMYSVGLLHEDELIIHHLLHEANRVVLTESKLYYYRSRANSIMDRRQRNSKKHLTIVDAFSERKDLFREYYPEIYSEISVGYMYTLCTWIFRMMDEQEKEIVDELRNKLCLELESNKGNFQRSQRIWIKMVLEAPFVTKCIWKSFIWIKVKCKNIRNHLLRR